MGKKAPGTLMIAGMVVSWTAYYAASKMTVAATGSAFLAGLLLRAAAFVFLTAQLIAERHRLLGHDRRVDHDDAIVGQDAAVVGATLVGFDKDAR